MNTPGCYESGSPNFLYLKLPVFNSRVTHLAGSNFGVYRIALW